MLSVFICHIKGKWTLTTSLKHIKHPVYQISNVFGHRKQQQHLMDSVQCPMYHVLQYDPVT
jgi:hypothetical protein